MTRRDKGQRSWFLGLASFLVAAPVLAEPATDAFTLPAELEAKLSSQAAVETGRTFVIERYAGVEELDHKANVGKVYSDLQAEFVKLDSGLYGGSGTYARRDGKANARGRSLSLCGLIPVLSEGSSVTDLSTTSALPLGKMFVPFGVRATMDFTSRMRLLALETQGAPLCNPSPGAEFSYRTQTELTLKTSGLFGGVKTFLSKANTRCQAQPGYGAASSLNPSFSGEVLKVNCEVETDGRKTKSAYSYVKDAGFYFVVETVDEWQRTTTTYSEVALNKP